MTNKEKLLDLIDDYAGAIEEEKPRKLAALLGFLEPLNLEKRKLRKKLVIHYLHHGEIYCGYKLRRRSLLFSTRKSRVTCNRCLRQMKVNGNA